MKNIAALLDRILVIAKDVKIWFRVLVLVVTGFAGAILFSRTKIRDCSVCEGQKAELVNALIHLKSMADVPVKPEAASYIQLAAFSLADSTPKQRMINRYIDSVLNKIKQDSIKSSRKG